MASQRVVTGIAKHDYCISNSVMHVLEKEVTKEPMTLNQFINISCCVTLIVMWLIHLWFWLSLWLADHLKLLPLLNLFISLFCFPLNKQDESECK